MGGGKSGAEKGRNERESREKRKVGMTKKMRRREARSVRTTGIESAQLGGE
jgi:hypothetical protein